MVRVLIVDDQMLFCQGLSALLQGRPEVELVAAVNSAESALARIEAERPEVVLMDMKMPGMSGPECTAEITRRFPETRVLALTTFDDHATVFAAIRAGALGYLLKDVGADELVTAIQRAARGESSVTPNVLSKVLTEFQRVSALETEKSPEVHGLSERELSVLKCLAQGKSNKEIAQALRIAEGTVKNHVTSIFEKLGVMDRTSAALKARDLGLG